MILIIIQMGNKGADSLKIASLNYSGRNLSPYYFRNYLLTLHSSLGKIFEQKRRQQFGQKKEWVLQHINDEWDSRYTPFFDPQAGITSSNYLMREQLFFKTWIRKFEKEVQKRNICYKTIKQKFKSLEDIVKNQKYVNFDQKKSLINIKSIFKFDIAHGQIQIENQYDRYLNQQTKQTIIQKCIYQVYRIDYLFYESILQYIYSSQYINALKSEVTFEVSRKIVYNLKKYKLQRQKLDKAQRHLKEPGQIQIYLSKKSEGQHEMKAGWYKKFGYRMFDYSYFDDDYKLEFINQKIEEYDIIFIQKASRKLISSLQQNINLEIAMLPDKTAILSPIIIIKREKVKKYDGSWRKFKKFNGLQSLVIENRKLYRQLRMAGQGVLKNSLQIIRQQKILIQVIDNIYLITIDIRKQSCSQNLQQLVKNLYDNESKFIISGSFLKEYRKDQQILKWTEDYELNIYIEAVENRSQNSQMGFFLPQQQSQSCNYFIVSQSLTPNNFKVLTDTKLRKFNSVVVNKKYLMSQQSNVVRIPNHNHPFKHNLYQIQCKYEESQKGEKERINFKQKYYPQDLTIDEIKKFVSYEH